MTRGLGTVRTLQRALPPALVPFFVVVTYLGSLWLLLPGVAVLYRYWDAERAAFVGSAVLGGFALTLVLKSLFAAPRPPADVRLVHATGYGFPSGHALYGTVAYGALARVARYGTRRQRALAAGLVVGLVALSRVVLGVHYVVDVVAGIAFGLGYLLVVAHALEQDVSHGLTVATGLAAASVAATGARWDSVLLLGGLVGARLGWARRGHRHD